jgi:hypothetical protein
MHPAAVQVSAPAGAHTLLKVHVLPAQSVFAAQK